MERNPVNRQMNIMPQNGERALFENYGILDICRFLHTVIDPDLTEHIHLHSISKNSVVPDE